MELTSASGKVGEYLQGSVAVVRAREEQIAQAQEMGWRFSVLCYGQVPPHQSLSLSGGDVELLRRLKIGFEVFVA